MSGPSREFRGIWIPADIWLSKAISVTEKVMLAEIDSLSKLKAGCIASNAHFAEMFDLSQARVSEIISSLASKGFVMVEQKRQGVRTVQRTIKVIPRDMTSTEIPKNFYGNPEEGSSEKAERTNTGITNTGKENQLFESFWKLYPKKKGKKEAEKAWRKVKAADVPAIMQALAVEIRSEQWLKNGGQYIPNPATWLNGERWNDEVQVANALPASSDGRPPLKAGQFYHPEWDAGQRVICHVDKHDPETGYPRSLF